MFRTLLLSFCLVVFCCESVQFCSANNAFTPSYHLCDVGDPITSLNGTITRKDDSGETVDWGHDCTKVIVAPKGYRIHVTVHENTKIWQRSDLFIYDGATRHNNLRSVRINRFQGNRGDRTITSTSNAMVVHIAELTLQDYVSVLNISFVMFRQPRRCSCLPTIHGETVCTAAAGVFYFGDLLERSCQMTCEQGYYIPNIFIYPPLRFKCSMDSRKSKDNWKSTVFNQNLKDKNQITCSTLYPATQVRFGLSFNYGRISCDKIDINFIQNRIHKHIVNHTSVPSVGECFKTIQAKNSPSCSVQSLNISCSNINNGTASEIKLLLDDNIIASDNTTITNQKFKNLRDAVAGNLSQSLKQFIPENLAIHNISASNIQELFHQSLLAVCPKNATRSYKNHKLSYQCIDCAKHFYKTYLSHGLYDCKICPNGTRRDYNEDTCVPGLRSYSKPSFQYCQHRCELGKYFNVNSSLCEWCPYGSYQNSTTILNPVCKHCPDGKTTGFVGAKDVSECITLCPAGKYLKYLTCVKCEHGLFMPTESNRFHKCHKCPLGNTTLAIGTASASGCVDKCVEGQYFNTTFMTCLPCPANTYQNEVRNNNTRVCKSCPPKTVSGNTGAKAVSECLGPCAAGQYIAVITGTCSVCPKNSYQDETEHVSFSCKSCGEYKITQDNGSTNLSQCIYPCDKGEFFNKTSATCEKCEINTYQDKAGKDFCIECPGKKFTLKIGSKQCISPCPPGKSLNKSAELCQDCLVGYYQNTTDYTSEECFPCPLDFYNNKVGRGNCSWCPDQTITVVTGASSSTECIERCEPGTFLNKTRPACQKCPKGFYQDQQDYRLENCAKCPTTNLTTLTNGASSLKECVGYCASSPCLNGGLCTNIDYNFNCSCPKHLTGQKCEMIIDENKTDIMVVSVRFPSLVWNENLSNPESEEFIELATTIEDNTRKEFASDITFRTVKVNRFWPGSVISDLQFSYVVGLNFFTPVDTLSSLVADGRLGSLTADRSSLKIVNFTCSQPLGMENGRIPDKAITAGISLHYHPPKSARLNHPGPGWAPQYLSGDEVYLQVDFGQEVVLTAIATQGSSFDGGSWLQTFYFQFSSNGEIWIYYQTDSGLHDVFIANSDVNTTVKNRLPVAVKTRYIRMFEYHFKEWISYRVEFYGCPVPQTVPLPTQVPLSPSESTPSAPTDLSSTTLLLPGDGGNEKVGLIVGLIVGFSVLFVLLAVVVWWIKTKRSREFGLHNSAVDVMQMEDKPYT